jgi:hypothetical protein
VVRWARVMAVDKAVSNGPMPSGSFLRPGEYRLVFTYRHDSPTQDRDSDVLSEAGNTTPEVATLDLPRDVLMQKSRVTR